MPKRLSVTLFVLMLSVPVLSVAAKTRPSVSDLLAQVQATYDKMQSYSSTGDITANIDMPGITQQEVHTNFSIKMARPDLYRIEWEAPAMMSRGAVWSAGDGNFLTRAGQAKPLQAKDMPTALAMATGISGGAAATIPAIFFRLSNNNLKRFKDGTFGPDASIDGDLCYVVTGKTGTFGTTLWISQKSKLLRQIRDDFSGPMKIPEMTDEQARETLQSMGQKPTAEGIKSMKAMMAASQDMMKSGMTEISIQVQRQVVVNASLRKADFSPQAGSRIK